MRIQIINGELIQPPPKVPKRDPTQQPQEESINLEDFYYEIPPTSSSYDLLNTILESTINDKNSKENWFKNSSTHLWGYHNRPYISE